MVLIRTVKNLVCTVHDHSFHAHSEACFRCHDIFYPYKSQDYANQRPNI